MKKYRIRFNKTRGQAGRGTLEHVWRVFDDKKEYIVKHVEINVSSFGEQEGGDWNIACYGALRIDKENSTAIIDKEDAI